MSVNGASQRDLRSASSGRTLANAATSSERNNRAKGANGVSFFGLTAEEETKCNDAFTAFDKDGSEDIDAEELRVVLTMMGIKVNEEKLQRMMCEASPGDPQHITKADFKRVIGKQRQSQSRSNQEDTLDAYVALGGNEDRSGHINAQQLVDIIKNQFEMTIDIEGLIAEVDEDHSGMIEYDEFMSLLTLNK